VPRAPTPSPPDPLITKLAESVSPKASLTVRTKVCTAPHPSVAPALSVGNAAGATGSVPTFTRRVRATGYAPRMVWVQVIARVSLAPLDPIPASSTREIVFATVAVVALSLAIVSVLITASVMGLAVVASPAA
jgi:hypothetical protein